MATPSIRPIPVLTLMLSLTACSDTDDLGPARRAQPRLAGGDESPVCKLFTREQIGSVLGTPVEGGHTAGPLGSGCSWQIEGSDRSVMVQIVPREYWEDGTDQPGGEALEGIGEKAFVGPWLDEHRAGALTANDAVYVMSPSKDASVRLLRDVATRVPQP
jgi:hypothetical protein